MHRLTAISLRHPKATAAMLIALTAFFAAGLPVRTEFGFRVLLGGTHPAIADLEGLIERFGGGLSVQVAWQCNSASPCSSVFDDSSLRMASDLIERLRPLEGIRTIEGLPTAPLLVPSADGFRIRRMVENGEPVADASLIEHALSDPLFVGRFVSRDGQLAVVVIQPDDTRSETELRVIEGLQRELERFEAKGFEFFLVGHAASAVVAGRALAGSMALIVPVTVVVILGVLLGLLRSVLHAALAIGMLGLALVWTFGLLGWLGWPRDAVLEVLAPLILAIGICDAVHFLSIYASLVTPSGSSRSQVAAIKRASWDVSAPCATTSITTMLAFSSFCLSDLGTFFRFGVASTFGVFCCLVLTFTYLPLVAVRVPIKQRFDSPGVRSWEALLLGTLRASAARPKTIVAVAAAVVGVCSIGWATRLQIDTYWYELVGEDSRIAQSIRLLEERLNPTVGVEIELELPDGQDLSQPSSLQTLYDFSSSLTDIEGLGKPTSIYDFVARLNRLLNDDLSSFERAADSSAANAELIDLIGFENPDLLGHWVSFDRSRVRVSIPARELSNADRERVLRAVDSRIGGQIPEDWRVLVSGGLPVDHRWTRDIQSTQLRSFPAAFALVFVAVSLFLRSAKLGLMAMVPTLLPVVVTLGAMGWMGMSLDVGRAMIAAVIIGIAVDDSIHVLTQYRRLRMEGETPNVAIGRAVLHVGRAVVTTSLALSLGFLTLMLSAWQTISSFGFFVALAILGALLATLFVLPALVFVFGNRGRWAHKDLKRLSTPARSSKSVVLTTTTVVPVLLALTAAAFNARGAGVRSEIPCWVLPTGRIAVFSGSDCPLDPFDDVREVRWGDEVPRAVGDLKDLQLALQDAPGEVEVAVLDGTEKTWHQVPVERLSAADRWARVGVAALVSVAFLCLPLVLIRRSQASAIVPFSMFYSAFAVIAVSVIGARDSIWLNRAALLATVFGPAILFHFSLTFPRRRRVVSDSPNILAFPYVACAVFFPVSWLAMEQRPLLWPVVVYLLVVLSFSAWLILAASCAFAVRESTCPLERARARMLLCGALLPAVLGFGLAIPLANGPLATLALVLALSIGVIPIPIGVAISRYNLFNLGHDVRFWVGRAVFYVVAGLCLAGAWSAALGLSSRLTAAQGFLASLFLSIVVLVSLEPLRSRLLGWMEDLLMPQIERLRFVQTSYVEDMAELREERGVLGLLGEAIESGLRPRSACVFLANDDGWEPVFLSGRAPPASQALLKRAINVLGDESLVQVTETVDGPADPALAGLFKSNVEVVAALRVGSELASVLLIGSSGGNSPYGRLELDFVAVVAAHAAMALRNARAAEALLVAEREAATGQTALALAHDVGKDVGLVKALAKRVAGRECDSRQKSRELAMVEDLSQELERKIRGFVRDATRRGEGRPGATLLEEAIERAVRVVSRGHGAGSVSQSVESAARCTPVPGSLESVLSNLLDNALLASGEGVPVHLHATREGEEIYISVSDRGCGMNASEREEAFELGYTTRSDSGGFGVGLAVSRDIAKGFGGSLKLEENPSGGTIAMVRVPAVDA